MSGEHRSTTGPPALQGKASDAIRTTMIKKVSRYLLGSKGRRDLAAAQENKLRDRGKQTPEHLDAFSDPNMELEEFCDRTLASMTQGALEEYEEQLTAQVAAADGMLEAEVLQHHSSFIGMCRGVAEMESKCQVLRNITATLSSQLDSLSQLEAVQAPLLVPRSAHSLSGDASDSLEAGTGRPRQQPQQPILQQQQPEARRMLSGSEASWAAVLDRLDEAMADGDMPNTTMLLQKAQAVLESVQETVEGAGRSEGAERDAAEQEEAVAVSKLLSQRLLDLEDVRARLVPMLQAAIAAATHDSEQVQDSLQLLGNVAGPVAAARALLDRRAAELEALQVSTRNAWTTALSSGDTDMIDHVSLLSQQAFGSVADAVRDVQAAFGGSTELAAVCTMWALHQARLHALLLTTDVLSAHSNAAGLTPVVLSICASLVYCKALEQSLGLCLTPTLLQSSLPLVVRVIRSKGGMMVEEAQRSVQADIQHLAASSAPLAEGKLLPSASRLVHETSRLASQLLPLAGPQLGRPMQSLMSRLVTGYFEGISRAANQHRLSSGAFRGALDKSLEVLMDMAYDFILALINAMEPLAAAVGRLVDASAAEEHLNALGAALGLQSSEPGAAAA